MIPTQFNNIIKARSGSWGTRTLMTETGEAGITWAKRTALFPLFIWSNTISSVGEKMEDMTVQNDCSQQWRSRQLQLTRKALLSFHVEPSYRNSCVVFKIETWPAPEVMIIIMILHWIMGLQAGEKKVLRKRSWNCAPARLSSCPPLKETWREFGKSDRFWGGSIVHRRVRSCNSQFSNIETKNRTS